MSSTVLDVDVQFPHHAQRLRQAFCDEVGTHLSMVPYVMTGAAWDHRCERLTFTLYIQSRTGQTMYHVVVGKVDGAPNYAEAARKILVLL